MLILKKSFPPGIILRQHQDVVAAGPNSFPTVFLNGKFLNASEASVSIQDRGFLYGDGLFETIRIHQKSPVFWKQHWQRLSEGCRVLRIQLPHQESLWKEMIQELLQFNQASEGLLRMQISRGSGGSGFSPTG